jgi:hypothetical protein
MPGINTQNDMLEETKNNLLEALTLVMDGHREMIKDEHLAQSF